MPARKLSRFDADRAHARINDESERDKKEVKKYTKGKVHKDLALAKNMGNTIKAHVQIIDRTKQRPKKK